MNDIKAALAGSVFSIIGMNLISLVGDLVLTLIFGAVGAFGGWLMGKLIKYLEKRYESKKKI